MASSRYLRLGRNVAEKRSASKGPLQHKAKSEGEVVLYAITAAFFALVLLAPMMIISESVGGQVQFTGEGSSLRQFGYLIVLALSIAAAIRYSGAKSLRLPWPLLAALAWCWLSLLWAVNADIAARRLVLTTAVVWNTFILLQLAGYDRTIRVLRIGFVLLLLTNYVVALLIPQVGVHLMVESNINTALVGNWRGIMGHKNVAGAVSALTILFFFFDAKKINRYLRIGVIIASLYFLYRSQSKTSGGMLVISIFCGWIFHRYDEKVRAFAIPMIMFITAFGWFIYSTYSKLVFDNYLNPTFFTGRGWIWSAMFRYSADHIIEGAGFGSFWNVGSDSPIYEYGQGWVRQVATGHNGYLDLLVSVGLPGVLLVIFATVIWPAWKLLLSRIVADRGALAVALLLFCMGHNITESSLLERDALIGVVMILVVAIAQNWEQVGTQAKKAKLAGSDLFAALSRRQRKHPETIVGT